MAVENTLMRIQKLQWQRTVGVILPKVYFAKDNKAYRLTQTREKPRDDRKPEAEIKISEIKFEKVNDATNHRENRSHYSGNLCSNKPGVQVKKDIIIHPACRTIQKVKRTLCDSVTKWTHTNFIGRNFRPPQVCREIVLIDRSSEEITAEYHQKRIDNTDQGKQ
jgi:hypothetical protein